MNLWRLALQGFWYHRRVNLAVTAAVAVATAVLTGALLVGDSMRGSLRALTLDRLGKIDLALISGRFFREQLAEEICSNRQFSRRFSAAAPVALMPSVTAEVMGAGAAKRARGVTLIGGDADFWLLDQAQSAPASLPSPEEIWLNRALADRLDAREGDRVVLRLPQEDQVPADSPLGRKDGRTKTLADLRVTAILPDQGLARFQLHPTQARSLNAFVNLKTLQTALKLPDRVNAIFVATQSEAMIADPQTSQALEALVSPKLDDYGIRIERVRRTYRPPDAEREDKAGELVAYEYLHAVHDRLIWSDPARTAATEAMDGVPSQEMFTYLANTIAGDDPAITDPEAVATAASHEIPYSTIVAVDSIEGLGPLLDDQGRPILLAEGEIALNSWAADDLGVTLGDPVWISYFAPETTHGTTEERTERFTLAAMVGITEPARPFRRNRPAEYDRRPTVATDPDLTPEVQGITDQETIANWDPPFPFDQRRIRPQDDRYWENYRTTPKAFISLAAGKQLWSSRFGQATSFRVSTGSDVASLKHQLELALRSRKSDLGFGVIPIKQNAIEAASGTTSFAGLFVGFSFFLIVAALLLLAILFRLSVERRLPDLGLLSALGWRRSRSQWLFLLEGAIVSVIGTMFGVAGGAAYAALMLSGLRTWWVDAIVTPFVHFFATPSSLIAGGIGSVLTCLLVMWASLRALRHANPRSLLAGTLPPTDAPKRHRRVWLPWLFASTALAAGMLATNLSAEAQAGAFFGSGVCVLVASLLWLRASIHTTVEGDGGRRLTLAKLALIGLARHPNRTLMTVGLIASACFLIIAIAAFRLAPNEQGTGGYKLIAETDRPLFLDFRDRSLVRKELGDQANALDGVRVLGLRAQAGTDASCRNLYQATRPKMLGIPRSAIKSELASQAKFGWAGTAAADEDNPWQALFRDSEDSDNTITDDVIPVILDKNTAMYSLHAGAKVDDEFSIPDASGRVFRFRTVGLLSNSIFQGKLLVSEDELTRLFPENSGYRYFLVDGSMAACEAANNALADRFGDEGWTARRADEVLGELLAIQNTYLSTFQSLGALGLLLGTVGLACVQIRNLIERRRELGLLQAIGFADHRIERLVFCETALMLILGVAIGTIAALVTTLPHMIFGSASIPWSSTLLTLLLVLVCGISTAALAARWALATPVLEALRGD